jgi:hypothetical protein
MIVISPWSKGGKITHSYGDHVSIVKFILFDMFKFGITARATTATGTAAVPAGAEATTSLPGFDLSPAAGAADVTRTSRRRPSLFARCAQSASCDCASM